MAKELVSDELWAVIEPLLPPDPPRPKGGRRRLPNRQVLTGILFVLRTGIPWEMLPQEMGCGSGMTCWRRLRPSRGTCCFLAGTLSTGRTATSPTRRAGRLWATTAMPVRSCVGTASRLRATAPITSISWHGAAATCPLPSRVSVRRARPISPRSSFDCTNFAKTN